MDSSFTEHILERARERQKKLLPLKEANGLSTSNSIPDLASISESKLKARKEVVSDPTNMSSDHVKNDPLSPDRRMSRQNSRTKISSDMPASPSMNCRTLNIQNDSLNVEIKVSSSENIRVEVEIDSDSENNTDVKPHALRDHTRDKLQRLEKLYSGVELSSPIHRSEANFHIDERVVEKTKSEDNSDSGRPKRGLGKLADLANTINQWEDDITPSRREVVDKKPANSKKSWKPPAPQPPTPQPVTPKSSPVKPTPQRIKPAAPKPPINSNNQSTFVNPKPGTPTSAKKTKLENVPKGTPKQLKWDEAVLETLESQGFTRTSSNTRLVYNFKNSQETKPAETNKEPTLKTLTEEPVEEYVSTKTFVPLNIKSEEQKVTPRSPTKDRQKSNAIANRAAMFESNRTSTFTKSEKDPALLSIFEKKKLFEKNQGDVLVPKAAFGMSAPYKSKNIKPSPSNENLPLIKPKPLGLEKMKMKTEVPVEKEPVQESIAAKIAQLTNKNKHTIAQDQIESKVKEERKKEMEVLMNRFNQNKKVVTEANESDSEFEEHQITETTAMISEKPAKVVAKSSTGIMSPPNVESRKSGEKRTKTSLGDSPQVQAVLGEVKRIKVAQPKDGKLYPCLSDIEATTETETEQTSPSPNNSFNEDSFYCSEGDPNTSFGREISQAVSKNPSPKKAVLESSESDFSDILDEMTDFLDELDREYSDTDSTGATPPKLVKVLSPKKVMQAQPSESFTYKNYSPMKQKSPKRYQSPRKSNISPPRRPTGENLPTHVVDGNDVMPLTYTVSFYRKQQATATNTPIRHISRQQVLLEESQADDQQDNAVTSKIEHLLEEVNKQEMVISQTSRALNLCNSTPEFIGSTEQVEAEKVLLLATHRRQAACMEIQRLEVEGTLRPLGSHAEKVPLEKGSLTISNITIPLKKEYVRALSRAGGKGHHVVCLVKCGEQVVSSTLVSTVASSMKNPDLELNFPDHIKLDNIYSDFTVTFEVYCLQAQEEILPHEVKYHINKKGSNKLTPKKGKQDSRLVRPPKESPAGPQAVRTSTFSLNGYVVFSIQAINKVLWTLNKTLPVSPLEGTVHMKVNCELDVSVEHHGFLNMFEDISGLGAWHRRWCLLKGHTISYWKYPEDERKKPPIDSIDLRGCITENVGPVSRDICARPNTFLMERERPAHVQDKDTLTVICKDEKTIIKHLLSADTKEERIEWCSNLNKALTGLKIWGNKS